MACSGECFVLLSALDYKKQFIHPASREDTCCGSQICDRLSPKAQKREESYIRDESSLVPYCALGTFQIAPKELKHVFNSPDTATGGYFFNCTFII